MISMAYSFVEFTHSTEEREEIVPSDVRSSLLTL
jgi:hypothetical protein